MSFIINKRIIHAQHLMPMDEECAKSNLKEIALPIVRERPKEPTALEMATNFAGAMLRWTKSGFKTVTAEEAAERSNICSRCEFWDKDARLGLGKCKAHGCGCTSIKFWLATEICPKGKWPDRGQFTKQ